MITTSSFWFQSNYSTYVHIENILKLFSLTDERAIVSAGNPWTWPFLDVFLLELDHNETVLTDIVFKLE